MLINEASHDGSAPEAAPIHAPSPSGPALRIARHEFRHRVALAPLSGITDVPFRRLVASFGVPLIYSEMVASGEFVKGDTESLLRAGRAGNGFHAVQLAGREPGPMREAASMLSASGADLIDINMGCPAKKVVGGQSGSALMRDLDLASRLIAATIEGAGNVPVTVKMRLGWDRQTMNAADLARRAQELGAVLVTVHGRTRDQFYDGSADWAAIAEVKRSIRIPVLANGDLTATTDRDRMLAMSEADGVMIGRGSCGRPWFPALVGGAISSIDLRGVDLATLVVSHYEAMLEHYGIPAGLRHARKHLGWYCDALQRGVSGLSGRQLSLRNDRAEILSSDDPHQVRLRLRHMLGGLTAFDVQEESNMSGLAA